MTAMIKSLDYNSDSNASDTPSPPHSKYTVNPKLKHSKNIEYNLNFKSKFLNLKTKKKHAKVFIKKTSSLLIVFNLTLILQLLS